MLDNFKDFLGWESAARGIDYKPVYSKITGDVGSGVLLAQVVFWYLPNKDGKTKLRVQKGGYLWIAKTLREWYEETGLNETSVAKAIKELANRGLVVKKRFKFNGALVTHLRLNVEVFLQMLSDALRGQSQTEDVNQMKEMEDALREMEELYSGASSIPQVDVFETAEEPEEASVEKTDELSPTTEETSKSKDCDKSNHNIRNFEYEGSYNRDYHIDHNTLKEEEEYIEQAQEMTVGEVFQIISNLRNKHQAALSNISSNLHVEIESMFDRVVTRITQSDFVSKTGNLYNDVVSYIEKSLLGALFEVNLRQEKENALRQKWEKVKSEKSTKSKSVPSPKRNTTRKEQLPDWFESRNDRYVEESQQKTKEELEEQRRRLELEMAKYKKAPKAQLA